MTHESTAALADRVLEQLQAVVVTAKAVDPFAAVVVVTGLGVRRLRLELGRRMALVNVRVIGPGLVEESAADGSLGGATVVVVGPVDAGVRERLDLIGYVHTAIPDVLDLGGVRIVSCPDAAVECRVAVSGLLAARGRGAPWSSMAVAVASTGSAPMLVDALKTTGIPFYRSGGRALSQSAAARFVIGAIRLADSGWNRGALSALWSSVPLVDPATGHLVPVAVWERVSRRWGAVDAHDWPALVDRCVRGNAAADAGIASSLVAFVDRFAGTIGSATREELAAGLTLFLPDPASDLGRALFSPSGVAEGEAVDEVRRALVTMPSESADGAPLTADERIRWFERSLAGRTMLGEGRIGEGVQVGTPEALCPGVFDAVVVVGLSDDATRRDTDRRALRLAALAGLVNGRAATVTVPRVSARSQREVAPFPELLEALTRHHGKPVTAEALHAWPSNMVGIDVVPSMTAARAAGSVCVPLDGDEHRLTAWLAQVSAGADLLQDGPDVPAGLRRSVGAGRARRGESWSAWDGRLEEMSGWSPTGTVWSVTTMESFHQCGLRVFLTDVLGARRLERPEDSSDPEARSVGTFVHKVMEYLAGDFLGVERSVRPSWTAWVRGLSATQVSSVVDRAVDDLRADGKLGRGPWWDAQVRWLEARIVHYLADEAAPDEGFEPVEVERGPTSDEPWILRTDAGEVSLQGRADRTEVRGETVRVVDFKTGSLKSLARLEHSDDPLDAGRRLQLPVYAAMNADRLGLGTAGASGVYVNPLSPNRSSRRVTLDAGSLVEPAKAVLRDAFEQMAEGMFTYQMVTEKGNDRFCDWCDVKACCPVGRIQMGRTKTAATGTSDGSGTGATA